MSVDDASQGVGSQKELEMRAEDGNREEGSPTRSLYLLYLALRGGIFYNGDLRSSFLALCFGK